MNATTITAEKGKHDFQITRIFNAPPRLVFRAFTEPELYIKWFMPREFGAKIESMTVKNAGSFRISHPGPNSMTFGFQGVYHEVIDQETIIKTSEFTGLPEKLLPVLEITRFIPLEGQKTEVSIHVICPSADYRDGMIEANMQATLDQTHVQLDDLLVEMMA